MKQKLRVGVLMGGRGIEREVSFNSGRTICDHLDTALYEIIPLFQKKNGDIYKLSWRFLHRGKISDFECRLDLESQKIIWDELKGIIDFIYLALHGRFAEDGTLQGMLEVLGIPYLGSGVFGSALGMNKIMQRHFLQSAGIDVPKGFAIYPHELVDGGPSDKENVILTRMQEMGVSFPCIVKPAYEGSSLGISVVRERQELVSLCKVASICDDTRMQPVVLEEKVQGMEFTCIHVQKIDNKDKGEEQSSWIAFPITEVVIEEGSDFYDYEQKYMPGRASKITPARCSEDAQRNIQEACRRVQKALYFSTLSRIDGFLTGDGKVVIFDSNSLSGMGPATFIFHQAAEIGMNHAELINHLIASELEHYVRRGEAFMQKTAGGCHEKNGHKKRIMVLLGGNSREREISLESGRNVCYKLSPQKYTVVPIFVDDSMRLFKLSPRLLIQNSTREILPQLSEDIAVKWADLPQLCDFVFIALHGGKGENGSVQGALEMLGLPYNGSGVLASALCMDKYETSRFLAGQGFDVPYSILMKKGQWQKIRDKKDVISTEKNVNIPFPCIVKPHDDGCSFFVMKAHDVSELHKAIDEIFLFEKESVMIEEFIGGMELTCGVIGDEEVTALPPSQPLITKDVLSIQEKFLPGAGENQTPANLPKPALNFVMKTMEQVYKSLGCKGYARIDCFYQNAQESSTKKQRVVILEINTLPALTPATCLFHQAAAIGMKPMDLIDRIVELGFENHATLFQGSRLKEDQQISADKI